MKREEYADMLINAPFILRKRYDFREPIWTEMLN